MPCCCEVDRDDDTVGIEPCCLTKNEGRKCLCLPYNDPFVIASQIIVFFAFSISWIWWAIFLLSAVGMIQFQVLWCCRHTKALLLASTIFSGVIGLMCLSCGIYMQIVWKDKVGCYVFAMQTDDYDWNGTRDYCPEDKWSIVAFVDSALWCTITVLMGYFIYSGRHEKWESKWRAEGKRTQPSVEMCAIPDAVATVAPSEVEGVPMPAAVLSVSSGKESSV